MSLDEQLWAILDQDRSNTETISQIKQAFAYEGYVDPIEFLALSRKQAQGKMTGAEWFDRFEKEVTEGWELLADEPPEVRRISIQLINLFKEAAKKASGL